MRDGSRLVIMTETICESDCVDTGDIEQCEWRRLGWMRAGITNVVAKLVRRAELKEGCLFEENPVPLLRKIKSFSVACNRQVGSYLKPMENIVCMLMDNATLAIRAR